MMAPELAWHQLPLFFELGALDCAVILVLGLCWSAAVWVLTEGLKTRLDVVRPFPAWVRWGPLVFSTLSAVPLFPFVLNGVGQPSQFSTATVCVYLMVGATGGIGAKAAHDLARGILASSVDRIKRVIKGGQNDK